MPGEACAALAMAAEEAKCDVAAVVEELDSMQEVREFVRTYSKLIAEQGKDPKLPVKPGMKTLKSHEKQVIPFARRMRDIEGRKAAPIDTIAAILQKLLSRYNTFPDYETLHNQCWDVKNLLTYLRGLWARSEQRPVKDLVLARSKCKCAKHFKFCMHF